MALAQHAVCHAGRFRCSQPLNELSDFSITRLSPQRPPQPGPKILRGGIRGCSHAKRVHDSKQRERSRRRIGENPSGEEEVVYSSRARSLGSFSSLLPSSSMLMSLKVMIFTDFTNRSER